MNIYVPEEPQYRKFTKTDQVMHVLGVAMVQAHELHKQLKFFGQEGKNEVHKEMQQHHDMEFYYPVDPSKLTYKEKQEAIELLLNLVKAVSTNKGAAVKKGGYAEEISGIQERR